MSSSATACRLVARRAVRRNADGRDAAGVDDALHARACARRSGCCGCPRRWCDRAARDRARPDDSPPRRETTPSQPSSARSSELASARSPSTTSTAGAADCARSEPLRASARTCQPAASNARATAAPTNPVAPVTSAFMRCAQRRATRSRRSERSRRPIAPRQADQRRRSAGAASERRRCRRQICTCPSRLAATHRPRQHIGGGVDDHAHRDERQVVSGGNFARRRRSPCRRPPRRSRETPPPCPRRVSIGCELVSRAARVTGRCPATAAASCSRQRARRSTKRAPSREITSPGKHDGAGAQSGIEPAGQPEAHRAPCTGVDERLRGSVAAAAHADAAHRQQRAIAQQRDRDGRSAPPHRRPECARLGRERRDDAHHIQ